MKTFVLEWDPAVSDYSVGDFQRDFPNIEYGDFEWGLDGCQGIRSGDNFILLKTGDGAKGIVMRGFFLSAPFTSREGFRASLRPQLMIHPDHPKGLLTTGELSEAVPDYPWEGGTSGRELPEEHVRTVDRLWDGYLRRFGKADYDCILLSRNDRPEAGLDEAVTVAAGALYDRKDPEGNPLILDSIVSCAAATSDEGRICAILKSVLTVPDWSAGALRESGFHERIIDRLVSSGQVS